MDRFLYRRTKSRTSRGYKSKGRHRRELGSVRHTPRPNAVVQSTEARVSKLSPDELLERYHELVDRQLDGSLDVIGAFELERIEARLNAEDRAEECKGASMQKEWQQQRQQVLESVQQLIARLRATG